jgi:phospholipid/cholesterol/gamma-HCH transport system ATP-binding protein
MISYRDLKKSFGDKHILRGVSFDVHDGEVLFIIGQSGAGKSVIIKHLVGLLAPDEGEIWLDGREISQLSEAQMFEVRKKCAMVFQHATLFDSMSCVENVALPLRKHRNMSQAEALTLDPSYVLFDEPTTSLDPVSARRVDSLIRELSDKLGVTSIVVSHDLASIFSIADRIVMLYEGHVRLTGTPEMFRQVDDDIVRQFIEGRADGPIP